MKAMKIHELKYLCALAQEGHFGRAAQRCHITQPTLSVAINNLEKRLKMPLFERLNHKIKLTEAGEKIIAQAQVVIDEVNKLEEIAKFESSPSQITLSLGSIYTIAAYVLPQLISAWGKRQPTTPLQTTEGYTDELIDQLLQGDIDVLILATEVEKKGLVQRKLYDEPLLWVLPSTHPKATAKTLSIEDVQNERLLLLGDGHCLRKHVLEACPTCIQRPEVKLQQGNSIESIKQMVASGYGISILPEKAATAFGYKDMIKAIPFTDSTPLRSIYITWRISYPWPSMIDALTDSLSKLA